MFSYDVEDGTIMIHDEIGPGWWGLIDAGSVIAALKAIGNKTVHVHLNTPGGSVDEGIAIYNAFKAHKAGVVTYVDSLAASMGSYLLQAGSTRIVASNSMVMVHDPWSIALGNATEFRKAADILEKYAQRMIPDYAKRSGKSDDEIKAIMAEESWYAGQEIVDAGFADVVAEESDYEPMMRGLQKIAMKVPSSLIKRMDEAAERRTTEAIAASMTWTATENLKEPPKATLSPSEAKEYTKHIDEFGKLTKAK